TSGDAAQYADRIIGWRTRPAAGSPDAEESFYRAAGLNYGPRGAPFAHVGELSLVVGLPTALVERALPFVTVYSGRAQVNVLDAPPEVLGALPGMNRQRLNAFLAQREAAPDRTPELLSLLGPSKEFATTEGSNVLRVRVRIAFDRDRRMSFEVVMLMFEGGNEPLSVLSWHDDLNGFDPGDGRQMGRR